MAGCSFESADTKKYSQIGHVSGAADQAPTVDVSRSQVPNPTSGPKRVDDIGEKITARSLTDLRKLFVSSAVIEALKKQEACLIIMVGMSQTRKWEVAVSDAKWLDQVLLNSPLRSVYDGQVRVISRDSILQTPLAEYRPAAASSIPVRPGALVYLQGRR